MEDCKLIRLTNDQRELLLRLLQTELDIATQHLGAYSKRAERAREAIQTLLEDKPEE